MVGEAERGVGVGPDRLRRLDSHLCRFRLHHRNPLPKALSTKTGKSVVGLGVALGIGLTATHHLVPPTPGPLGVAGIFGVDIGVMILTGMLFGIPVFIAGIYYSRWLGKKIYQLPDETGLGWVRPEQPKTYQELIELEAKKDLPSLTRSLAPIVVPILLIFVNTTLGALELEGRHLRLPDIPGSPVIAVGLGLLIAIYGLIPHLRRSEALDRMEEGIARRDHPARHRRRRSPGERPAGRRRRRSDRPADRGDLLRAVLIPFVIATLIRLIQGSGTVAMITAASISAPILSGLDVNMVLAAQGAAIGSMVFSYFNDSMFWVANRMLGIRDIKEQILTWSVPTTLAWLVSLIMLLIATALFG